MQWILPLVFQLNLLEGMNSRIFLLILLGRRD